ncbi:MAG: hypothetical protein DBW72_03595 [Flavobacteriales bacterium]|nr:MAG: hypothetical protein DBW72_03595 [Flavobacteriales bacterium]
MIKFKYISLALTFSILFSSCETNDASANSKNTASSEIDFDADFTQDLYEKIMKASEDSVTFSQQQLIDFLKTANPEEVKNGNSYESELLFESIECDCLDQMSLSYDENQDAFILGIYEETYVEDMDWCPESAYQFSFGVKNQKAINVSFEFLAG